MPCHRGLAGQAVPNERRASGAVVCRTGKAVSGTGVKVTAPLPFTKNGIKRALDGAREAGLKVSAITIGPDGAITLYETLEPRKPSIQDAALSKWADPIAT
jgi:hypothetical protein